MTDGQTDGQNRDATAVAAVACNKNNIKQIQRQYDKHLKSSQSSVFPGKVNTLVCLQDSFYIIYSSIMDKFAKQKMPVIWHFYSVPVLSFNQN